MYHHHASKQSTVLFIILLNGCVMISVRDVPTAKYLASLPLTVSVSIWNEKPVAIHHHLWSQLNSSHSIKLRVTYVYLGLKNWQVSDCVK